MHRLKEFRFLWTDAWNHGDTGYDSILEITDNGSIYICFLVDGKSYMLPLHDREDGFINALEKIDVQSWDKKCYEKISEDSWHWFLSITYDDQRTICLGAGGYPKGFIDFIDLLLQYGIPQAGIANKKAILHDSNNVKIRMMTDYEWSSYCRTPYIQMVYGKR